MIWLMLSVQLSTKLITLSGVHCIAQCLHYKTKFLMSQLRVCYTYIRLTYIVATLIYFSCICLTLIGLPLFLNLQVSFKRARSARACRHIWRTPTATTLTTTRSTVSCNDNIEKMKTWPRCNDKTTSDIEKAMTFPRETLVLRGFRIFLVR